MFVTEPFCRKFILSWRLSVRVTKTGHGTDSSYLRDTLLQDLPAFIFLYYSNFISNFNAVIYPSNKDFGFNKLLREIIFGERCSLLRIVEAGLGTLCQRVHGGWDIYGHSLPDHLACFIHICFSDNWPEMSCNQDILFITYYYYMMDFNLIIITLLFGKTFERFNCKSLKMLFMQPCSVVVGTYLIL